MRLARDSVSYIVFLGALSALTPLSIDMGLPALPGLARDLAIAPGRAAETISVFFLGLAAGPILFGPLTDRYGRRVILVGGLALFALAAIGSALAPTIEWLLGLRCVQGLAAGAVTLLPPAIVRDQFSGNEAQKRQSSVTLVHSVGPLAAPLLGAVVLLVGDWRLIYSLIGLAGLVLFSLAATCFAETLPPERRIESARWILSGYARVLSDRGFLVAMAVLTLNSAGMFAYIASAPLVFMNNLGLSGSEFGLLFAIMATGMGVGAGLGGRLIHYGISSTHLVGSSLGVSAAAASGILLLAHSGGDQLIPLVALILVSNICVGIVMPNSIYAGLQGLAHAAGTGSALLRSAQMVGGAMATALVAQLYDNQSPKAMAMVMTCCALAAGTCFLLGRRFLYPGSTDAIKT